MHLDKKKNVFVFVFLIIICAVLSFSRSCYVDCSQKLHGTLLTFMNKPSGARGRTAVGSKICIIVIGFLYFIF